MTGLDPNTNTPIDYRAALEPRDPMWLRTLKDVAGPIIFLLFGTLIIVIVMTLPQANEGIPPMTESIDDIRKEMSTRESCLDCGRKHLGKAKAKLAEGPLGYPRHAWYAVGEMAEAEDELIDEYPEVAAALRQERIALMDSLNEATTLNSDQLSAGLTMDPSKVYEVPWDALMDLLCNLAAKVHHSDEH